MCLFVSVCVRRDGYLIEFNSIVISLFFQFKWVSFYQRARALHSELILHLPSNTLPSLTTLHLRVVVKSVSWNRAWVYLFCFMRECVKFYLRYLFAPPDRFCFVYAKYLLACSTCLLCTTLFLLFFLFSLRPIICSYETKLNFSSLLFLFFFVLSSG